MAQQFSVKWLTIMDLSNCQYLARTPDFSTVPKLERLILEGCKRLSEVHPTIGGLQHLVLLNLKGCESVESLPFSISLESLKTLVLSGCLKLKWIPEFMVNMENLSELHLDGTAISKLPESIQHLSSLILLNLRGCKKVVQSLPKYLPQSLKFIDARDCPITPMLTNFPKNCAIWTSEYGFSFIDFGNSVKDVDDHINLKYIEDQIYHGEPFEIHFDHIIGIPDWCGHSRRGSSVTITVSDPKDERSDLQVTGCGIQLISQQGAASSSSTCCCCDDDFEVLLRRAAVAAAVARRAAVAAQRATLAVYDFKERLQRAAADDFEEDDFKELLQRAVADDFEELLRCVAADARRAAATRCANVVTNDFEELLQRVAADARRTVATAARRVAADDFEELLRRAVAAAQRAAVAEYYFEDILGHAANAAAGDYAERLRHAATAADNFVKFPLGFVKEALQHSQFSGKLNKASHLLQALVSMERSDLKVKGCGIQLISQQGVAMFARDLTQATAHTAQRATLRADAAFTDFKFLLHRAATVDDDFEVFLRRAAAAAVAAAGARRAAAGARRAAAAARRVAAAARRVVAAAAARRVVAAAAAQHDVAAVYDCKVLLRCVATANDDLDLLLQRAADDDFEVLLRRAVTNAARRAATNDFEVLLGHVAADARHAAAVAAQRVVVAADDVKELLRRAAAAALRAAVAEYYFEDILGHAVDAIVDAAAERLRHATAAADNFASQFVEEALRHLQFQSKQSKQPRIGDSKPANPVHQSHLLAAMADMRTRSYQYPRLVREFGHNFLHAK
ncbi:hypothetical protein M0R45_032743 [Rubus argutus]|uniref:Uncharacterized protein n=1 Tax=Rubus argutus TaxID=59490 RepID=A0AAW1WL63_RUBAR